MGKYLSSLQVAKRLNVTTATVRRWARTKQIQATRVGRRGHWKIPAEYVFVMEANRSE